MTPCGWDTERSSPSSVSAVSSARPWLTYDVPPKWTDLSGQDQGIALLEILAYAGDMLSYYQDQIAEQSRLRTRGFVVLARV
jgi:hypothetical protein